MSNHGNGNQQQTKAPEPAKTVSNVETGKGDKPVIAVKRIVFAAPIDFPEKSMSDSLPCAKRSDVFDAAGERINRQKVYLVDYLPWLRGFRVTYYPSTKAASAQERMVPEAQVRSWDPA